jgi:alpha-1,6-mannosyltransferase
MKLRLLRFGLAAVAELILIGALNLLDDWTLESMPVNFVICAVAAGVAYFFAVSQWPTQLTVRQQAVLFWSIAVLLRLSALPLAPGDDLWRYEWEGKIQRAGFNPYVVAPDDPQLAQFAENFPNWDKINHREFTAIYPPGAQLVFRALSAISDRPLLYKFVFAAADLAAAALLVRLIGGANRFARAAWYGWNPLVVYSFAGAAHFDSLMVLSLVAGILFLVRQADATDPASKWSWALAAAVAFGVAISLKLVPLLLLPLCAIALGRRAVTLLASIGLPAALSTIYGWPKIDIWHSLGQFAKVTRLNDLFWWVVEATVSTNPRQKNVHYNVAIIACVLLISLLFFRNWKRGMLWVMGTALVLSPVLHPWYCTWILPLAAWRDARVWHVLSITLFAYYLFWNERLFALPWHSEPWMRAIIILPPLIALLLEWRERRRRPLVEAIGATDSTTLRSPP